MDTLLDRFCRRDDVLASHGNGEFASVEFGVGCEIGKSFNRGVVGMRLEDGLFAFNG